MPGSPKNWTHARRYGVEQSYKLGMEWLERCSLVEDWGCGPAYSKLYRKGPYRGIDGTGPYCDEVADLRFYRSSVPGIFMRHVLEHNLEWKPILENALESFQERMSLVFFTPWAKDTHIAHYSKDVPFIRFRKSEILELIGPYLAKESLVPTTKRGLVDTVFCLEKNKKQ